MMYYVNYLKVAMAIFVFIYFSSVVFSQDQDNMYLLMAYKDDFDRITNDRHGPLPEIPKVLFKYYNFELRPIDTINFDNEVELQRIVHFKDDNFFYIEEAPFYNDRRGVFQSILDYKNDSLVLRRFDTRKDQCYLGYLPFGPSIKDNGQVWLQVEGCMSGSQPSQEEITANRSFINRYFERRDRMLHLSDFQKIYKSGASPLNQNDFTAIYTSSPHNNGPFKTIGYGDDSYRPKAWIQIPNSIRDTTVTQLHIVVNNNNYFVAKGRSGKVGSKGYKIKYNYIYDKVNCNWSVLKLTDKVDYTIATDGEWMFGTEYIDYYDNKTYLKSIGKNIYDDVDEQNRIDLHNKYNSMNGNAPDLSRSTGRIIIYHIMNDIKKIVDLEELDSEIIDIVEDKLYYRVFDELRVANIEFINNKIELFDEQILIKDQDVMPFVHHLFFSKSDHTSIQEIEIVRDCIEDCYKCN